tara:strand:- start:336 stop:566 length:231 start_codon:yes stop_codon:yes gene_type:complete
MFRPQAQAETHSRPGRALRGSRPPCAETHSKRPGPPLASSGTYFFLFLNRLQAQAQAHATAAADQVNATHYFIDSP